MFEIDFDIKETTSYIKKVEEKALKGAIRKAQNTGIRRASTAAYKDLKTRYGMEKSGVSRPSFNEKTEVNKVKMMEVLKGRPSLLRADVKSLSLIHFVVGSKEPQKQKGIKVKNRKPLIVSVRSKSLSRPKKSFIAKPSKRKGGVQVFSKATSGKYKGKLIKQTIPQVISVLTREEIQKKMEKKALTAVEKAFYKEFDRIVARLS